MLGPWRSCAAAVPAWHLRRPVRLALDRDEDMQTTGHRHAFQATYKACPCIGAEAMSVQNECIKCVGLAMTRQHVGLACKPCSWG